MQVKHKAFVARTILGRTVYWNVTSRNMDRDRIRNQAETFVNEEIGAENVISVTEHAMSFGPFSVVVWYRVPEKAS